MYLKYNIYIGTFCKICTRKLGKGYQKYNKVYCIYCEILLWEKKKEEESDSETWDDEGDEYWDGDSYYEEIFEKYENGEPNISWNPDINRHDYDYDCTI